MNEPLLLDTKCLQALKRLDAIEADMKRRQNKWLAAYAKRVEAKEHARRRAMPRNVLPTRVGMVRIS